MTLKEEILELLKSQPGRTDREITNVLRGASSAQQPINIACRDLAAAGVLDRRKRLDGLIGNYLSGRVAEVQGLLSPRKKPVGNDVSDERSLSEDEVKSRLVNWLENQGWAIKVAWSQAPGIDLDAAKEGERWIIEVKGCGSRPQMRVNYFLAVLGESLQRMSDPQARYSIAMPDLAQFRKLWQRLPAVAKQRTGISALFVNAHGSVDVEN